MTVIQAFISLIIGLLENTIVHQGWWLQHYPEHSHPDLWRHMIRLQQDLTWFMNRFPNHVIHGG